MVSILPPISSFLRYFTGLLGAIPRAPTEIGITVTFMFHSVSALTEDPDTNSVLFTFFYFHFRIPRNNKMPFFFSCSLIQGRVFWSRFCNQFLTQNLRILWVFFKNRFSIVYILFVNEILASCSIPRGSFFLLNRICSWIPSVSF